MADRRRELGGSLVPIPEEWERAVAACLAKEASGRPPTARAVLDALQPASPAAAVPAPSASPRRTPGKAWLAVGAGLVAIAATGLGWYYGSYRPEQERIAENVRRDQVVTAQRHAYERSVIEQWARVPADASDEEFKRREALVARYRQDAPAQDRSDIEAIWQQHVSAWQERRKAETAAREEAGRAALRRAGQPWTVADLGLEMVPIAAGSFSMGAPDGYANERPVTKVTLTRPFWMGKTEVTQGQWRTIMQRTQRQEVVAQDPIFTTEEGDDIPIHYVTWRQAMEFCQRLTEREQQAGRLPQGHIYTLPTEAQWEYACRAGTTGPFAGEVEEMAWLSTNSKLQQKPVAQKRPNAWGLHDMHGNVYEYCLDWYGTYPGGSVTDPRGRVGTSCSIRGGFANGDSYFARSSGRSETPLDRRAGIGFRVVLVPAG
jgi:formylglycine-generating enzyme required for sulfatase activity